jgi:hypothetical protein
MKYNAKFLFYFSKLSKKVKIGTNRALYRVAGLVRTTERRTIRVRPNASRPGTPPHAHTSGGLRVIEFHVSGNRAIIGPKRFAGSSWWNQPVTHIHEFGGQFVSRKGNLAKYPQRSYAGETLNRLQKQGKIPKQFAVSIAEVIG